MELVRFKQQQLRPVAHAAPGQKCLNDNEAQAFVNSEWMGTCDSHHDRLRAELMKAAQRQHASVDLKMLSR